MPHPLALTPEQIAVKSARFNRQVKLAIALRRHAVKHKWSTRKLRFWQNFMMPPIPSLHWTMQLHNARIARGPHTSHINPHTGEQNGRTL